MSLDLPFGKYKTDLIFQIGGSMKIPLKDVPRHYVGRITYNLTKVKGIKN